MIKQCRIKK